MITISNSPKEKKEQLEIRPQSEIQYVPKIEYVTQYVDREVVKEIEVKSQPETVYIETEPDLTAFTHRFQQHEDVLKHHHAELQLDFQKLEMVAAELEMQRQALVGLKIQRNIDRKNKLRLINRLKKERKKSNFKFKLMFGFSLLLLASLFLKH